MPSGGPRITALRLLSLASRSELFQHGRFRCPGRFMNTHWRNCDYRTPTIQLFEGAKQALTKTRKPSGCGRTVILVLDVADYRVSAFASLNPNSSNSHGTLSLGSYPMAFSTNLTYSQMS